MKLRNSGLIRLVALLAAWVIRWWMRMVRIRYAAGSQEFHPAKQSAGRFIYVFWHESLLVPAATPTRGRVHVLISQHADGELIAQVCRLLNLGTIRGSSTRGGAAALREMLEQAKTGHLAIAPDGPRGPRRKVQMGVVFLAAQTGLPIVPVGVGFSRAWRARSWDRFAVPWPGSTACCVVGRAVRVPERANRAELEKYREVVEQELLRATATAEEWASAPARSNCRKVRLPATS
jgi:lysophospholipid acyltransferase (LPLAT)-like uncharacterized protein